MRKNKDNAIKSCGQCQKRLSKKDKRLYKDNKYWCNKSCYKKFKEK